MFVLLAFAGCESPRPPPAKVELHGSRYELHLGSEPLPVFDGRYPPRWRVEPAMQGGFRVEFESDSGGLVELATEVERADDHLFVRTPTTTRTATVGDFTARLRLDDSVVSTHRIRMSPRPRHHPASKQPAGRADAEGRFRALQASKDPELRYIGYLMEGRLHMEGSVHTAGEIWRRGARELAAQGIAPRAADYLRYSSLFTRLVAERLDEAERDIEAWFPDCATSREERCSEYWYSSSYILVLRQRRLSALTQLRRGIEATEYLGDQRIRGQLLGTLGWQLRDLGRYNDAIKPLKQGRAIIPLRRHHLQYEYDLAQTHLVGTRTGAIDVPRATIRADFIRLLEAFDELGQKRLAGTARVALADMALEDGDLGAAQGWISNVSFDANAQLGFERWYQRLVHADVLLQTGALDAAEERLEFIEAGLARETREPGADHVYLRRLFADLARARKDPRATDKLEAAWQQSLQFAKGLGLGGAGHILHLHRDLPVRLAHARAEDPIAAALVVEEALRARWMQLLALQSIEAQPEPWRKLEDARAKRNRLDKEPCGTRPPGARQDCEQAKTFAGHEVRELEIALIQQLTHTAPSAPRQELLERQAALTEGEGILLGLAAPERAIAVLITKDRVHVEQGLEALAPRLARLRSVATAGDLDLTVAQAPGGRPWGARLAVRRWPSATWRPRTTEPANGAPIAFADPKGDLPHTRRGAKALAKQLKLPLHLDVQARKDTMLTALKAHPSLLVFAGHAESLELDRTSTQVMLHDDGVDMQDILTQRLYGGLIVLNGCASGGPRRGYGVGLGEALLLEGTRAVLATVEPVKDEDAHRFIERFFRNGGRDHPERGFKRAIQASVKANDDVYEHYRLWAR